MALFNTIRQFATNFPGVNQLGNVINANHSQTALGLPFRNPGFQFGSGQNDSFQSSFPGGFQTGFPGGFSGGFPNSFPNPGFSNGFNGITPPPKPDASQIDTNNDGSIDQAELLAFNPTDPSGNTITLPDTVKQQMANQVLNGQTSIPNDQFNAMQPRTPQGAFPGGVPGGFQGGFNGGFQGGFPGAGFNGMMPPPKPDASQIDTNNDGSIDQAELLAFNPTDPSGNTITLPDTVKQQMANQVLNGQTSISNDQFNALQPPPPPFRLGMGRLRNTAAYTSVTQAGSQLQNLITTLTANPTGNSQNSDIATQLKTILNLLGNSSASTL